MSQVNLSTGKERNIRCVPWPSSLSDQWEWQDEHRKWNLYPPVIQRLLGACHLCGVDQWEVEALGKKYNVELENKVQINVETGVKRKVRCVANGSRANKEGGVFMSIIRHLCSLSLLLYLVLALCHLVCYYI